MHGDAVRALVPFEHRAHRRLRALERVFEILEVEIEAVVEGDRGNPRGKSVRRAGKQNGDYCRERDHRDRQ